MWLVHLLSQFDEKHEKKIDLLKCPKIVIHFPYFFMFPLKLNFMAHSTNHIIYSATCYHMVTLVPSAVSVINSIPSPGWFKAYKHAVFRKCVHKMLFMSEVYVKRSGCSVSWASDCGSGDHGFEPRSCLDSSSFFNWWPGFKITSRRTTCWFGWVTIMKLHKFSLFYECR